MQVLMTTDNHIHGSDELTRHVETVVEAELGRFGEWITRVEVKLTDENSRAKAGDDDKRCAMEARPAGRQPVAASHQAATVDQAVHGCAKKLARVLADTADRLKAHKGSTPYSG